MRISEITPQKKSGRFNLHVESEFYCGISERTLAKFGLYKGKDVQPDQLEEIFREEIIGRLYDRCIGKISRRPQSELELRTYCRRILWKNKRAWFSGTKFEKARKSFTESLVEEVIHKLQENKLISDAEFAKWWVEQRKQAGNRGWALIKSELKGKGIDQDIVNGLSLGRDDEITLINRAKEKYCRGVSIEKCRQRLARRGFSWDAINSAVPWDTNNEMETS